MEKRSIGRFVTSKVVVGEHVVLKLEVLEIDVSGKVVDENKDELSGLVEIGDG